MNTIGGEAAEKSHHGGTEADTKGPPAARPHAAEAAAVQIQNLRASVVREAESWIGTPFHHAARIKGAGIDCLMLLAEIYDRAGAAPHIAPPFYVPYWHLPRDAERYLEGLCRYASEISDPPLPGDIALFRFGRTFSHGAIVSALSTHIGASASCPATRPSTPSPAAR